MGPPLEVGLGLNANETLRSTIEKSITSEALSLDYVWIADLPDQLYAPVVASVVAASAKRIRIGIGLMSVLLHTPRQIAMAVTALNRAYGERFDLCIGAGDLRQLSRVGLHLDNIRDLPLQVLKAKRQISDQLRKSSVKAEIWLGAQGPKMLAIAKAFDGVLLNFSKPEMIEWAIAEAGLGKNSGPKIGIYSPSYVHLKPRPNMLLLAKLASATVAIGASSTVLRRFGLYDQLRKGRKLAKKNPTLESVLYAIPDQVIRDFSITMKAANLRSYLAKLESLKVKHIVFAYPQGYSVRVSTRLFC